MDIERLSKMQIVLLTLLVSFVTSIATGIATVSLIEKAPVDVMRVIDRIVEKPIETFIPSEKEVITKTVVVQENELIAQAVESMRPSLVRLYEIGRSKNTFVALGIITNESGGMVSGTASFKEKGIYLAVLDDGATVRVVAGTNSNGVVTFAVDSEQEGEMPVFRPVTSVAAGTLKLGQTVVVLSGGESYTVSPGVITTTIPQDQENTTTGGIFIKTTIDTTGMAPGTPLMTNKGELIGIIVPDEAGLFRPISL